MWAGIAKAILQNRVLLLVIIAVGTVFMAYQASRIELSYDPKSVLPSDDSTQMAYQRFKERFGQDGSVMVIGWQDTDLYQIDKFNGWYDLTNDIKKMSGIQDVLSMANLYNITRNDSLSRFDFKPILSQKPSSQLQLDSLKNTVMSLPFYEGLIYDSKSGTTLMLITFDQKKLNSSSRITIVNEIKEKAEVFAQAKGVNLHYSGMPFIRTEVMKKVSGEMKLFMGLAILVTGLILWAFFRSGRAVWLSLVVVIIGVLFALGTIYLMGYKITILTGLIPPLLIVIGVPNCIFLLNKYQSELLAHGDQPVALRQMIEKIGLSTFLANITTAIGFGVFYFTNSSLLIEFGLVAAINVMVTYAMCLILIPIALSYLPLPSLRHTQHLEGKRITGVLVWVDHLVHNHRHAIYLTVGLMVALSAWGATKILVVGYVVDDLPKKDPIYTDLRFFEKNFHGVLPFEISIDTKQKDGVFGNGAKTLYKIKALQKMMSEYPEFSRPLSVVEALRFLYQSYKGGQPKYYILPGGMELKKLSDYTQTLQGKENKLQTFLDSSRQVTRVSYQMADVGSSRIKELQAEIQPRIDSIFPPNEYEVNLTGHSLVFLKSNDYLLGNLYESLVIAIILIALVGMVLFRSIPIIILSKLPCLIPLLITAGMMGFFNIHFKPSTILIFSIAFGIASDGTVYFLTKYRQELKNKKRSVSEAISITIRETGISMIYTAIILFCGFGIFAASSFGGTAALGILLSITLLVAMATNLVLLPALLLSLEKRRKVKAVPVV
ncbi:MAG: MMPL family transporter [Bacteroidota bacterium]